jgi:long-chain fatty acid transport protein
LRNITFHFFCAIIPSVLIVCISLGAGYQLNEHGARAVGLGGAFVAQASDPSAIFFNPAGLAYQSGINIMGGGTFVMPSISFKGPAPSTTETKMESQIFFPPNLYGTYALNNKWVVGIGLFTPYGLGSEWNKDWVGRAISVKTSIQTFYINPTVSYKISDQLAVGVGLSYIYGTVSLSKRVVIPPAGVNGTLSLDGNGTGIGYNIGVLCKPTEKLSLGASFRSLTKLEFSGDAKFSDMLTLAPFFPGGTGKATLPMPADVFVGAAYQITSDLTVEADFQFVGWSSYDQLVINLPTGPAAPAQLGGQPLQKTQTQIKKWDDGYLGRLGAEYRYNDRFAFRAGLIYDISPQPASKMEPMLPDADRIDVSIGAGYKINQQLSVDIAYMIVLFADRTSTFIPDGSTSAFGGPYSSTANLLSIDLSYQF